ncbi:MAG: gamma-glutamylcyclotransferase [Rhodospirillales bacterium]|nr:gamma-glutamylcyclotransferase [Rhodospirillales bacterium]MSP79981.1 gamma-glutamylcyclotransferase [Rhodospirillales bacterium]
MTTKIKKRKKPGGGRIPAAIVKSPRHVVRRAFARRFARGGIWVFGYGSLMWRPGFAFGASRPARISGYHRALCVYSVRYRGTRTKPGLVLGLDRGGSCVGRVFRVAARNVKRTLAYLHEREMPHRVYGPSWLRVVMPKGAVRAYVFVVRRDHPQYTGRLSLKRTVALVLAGRGIGGTCLDYLRKTVRHMDELGVADTALHRVLAVAEKTAKRRRTPPKQKARR